MATAFTTRQIPTFSAVRHQPVATKSAAAGRRHLRHVFTLVAIGVIFMLAFVWIRIRVIQLGYDVSKIRKETSELKQQKSRLESEVERLKSPARIEAIANDVFMMRLPQGDEIVIVGPGAAALALPAPKGVPPDERPEFEGRIRDADKAKDAQVPNG